MTLPISGAPAGPVRFCAQNAPTPRSVRTAYSSFSAHYQTLLADFLEQIKPSRKKRNFLPLEILERRVWKATGKRSERYSVELGNRIYHLSFKANKEGAHYTLESLTSPIVRLEYRQFPAVRHRLLKALVPELFSSVSYQSDAGEVIIDGNFANNRKTRKILNAMLRECRLLRTEPLPV